MSGMPTSACRFIRVDSGGVWAAESTAPRGAQAGAILREDELPGLRMPQGELARRLRVSRVTINALPKDRIAA